MLGYVTIGVRDVNKAAAFYGELLESLGAKVLMSMDRIAFIGENMGSPMLAVCVPYDEKEPTPGNGNMIAIPAASKEDVDALYAKALSIGATDEGAPGQRLPTFYGAYIRDLDGNKVCFYIMG